jgi:hypothetical protein
VTDTNFGANGSNRLTAAHKSRSIFSLRGGKNSKDIFSESSDRRTGSRAASYDEFVVAFIA